MACFDLSKSLCDDISQLVCKYWLSQNDEVNKMHWVGWEKMKLPKEDGGLGFRDLYFLTMPCLRGKDGDYYRLLIPFVPRYCELSIFHMGISYQQHHKMA
jgi:hypothetical protein